MWGGGGALTSQVDLSEPRYPEKAFCPQGHCMGLQMGAKADTACRRHVSSQCVPLFIFVLLSYSNIIMYIIRSVVCNMSTPCWASEVQYVDLSKYVPEVSKYAS